MEQREESDDDWHLGLGGRNGVGLEKRLRSRPIANNCYSRSGNLEAPTWRERDMRWSFSNSALCGNHAPKARLPLPINGNRNVGYSKSKREDKK